MACKRFPVLNYMVCGNVLLLEVHITTSQIREYRLIHRSGFFREPEDNRVEAFFAHLLLVDDWKKLLEFTFIKL